MAGYDYHKGNDKVVQQLNELFGDKLNIDVIKMVAKSCQFDVRQSSNELSEIADTGSFKLKQLNYTKIDNYPACNITKKSRKAIEIERTIKEINEGFKVLILLRGLPGSGKSTLAKAILQNTIGYSDDTARKHILSTDDFFMNKGVYEYNPNQLSEAHGWNHQRAFNVMCKGYSPVIIDNTNTQMWEMKPYALMATDYGYILEILEPDTHWCFNDKELEKRNKHGVPKNTIRNMLERYQKNVTPMKLLTAYDCKYKLQKPPQYRLHPPLPQIHSKQMYIKPLNGAFATQCNGRETANFMNFYEPSKTLSPTNNKVDPSPAQSSSVDDILMHGDSSFLKAPVLKPMHTNKIKQSCSLFDNINAWGVDEMALRSWDIVTPVKENNVDFLDCTPIIIGDEDEVVETRVASTSTDDEDFYILRNILNTNIPPPKTVKVMNTCNRDINRGHQIRPLSIRKKLMIDKSCLTEDLLDDYNVHLANLSRVLPHFAQNVIKYWYEKCNRDFDCTIELLISESDEFLNVVIDEEPSESEKANVEFITIDSDSSSSVSEAPAALQNSKHKRKNNSSSSDESQDLKKYIESKVTISADHYSEKLLKIKKMQNQTEPESPKVLNSPVNMEMDVEDLEWEDLSPKVDSDDNVETVELNLGDHFVKQLEDNFGDPDLIYPKGFQPVVQMPVALARQLYTFYIESVYQQMEVQNSIMEDLIKEDEEFARKLQDNEEPKLRTEPFEFVDIMKEQKELAKWQREADKWKEDTPDTLAARLTREKLFNTFPTIDRNTLVEILHAHNNVYSDTIETLLASTGLENVSGDIKTIKNPPINTLVVEEMWEAHESCKNNEEYQDAACSAVRYREEANEYLAKRKNMYEKAQKYYQNGMKEVAQFYSGLASKLTRLYENANSLAATAFLDEHSKSLENFNILDLHYLYVKEAIPHLDIFIDRHINLLRLSSSKNSECLQIITGKGKNSKNGIAKIKPAVIARLEERKISYQLLNPGLLKIKVTKVSKVTSEL